MSSGTMVLQPIPCVPGYSQLYGVVELSFGRSVREKVGEAHSKSMPSRSSLSAKLMMVCTDAVRFFASATAVEKKREPVQPPTETNAFTPFRER